LGALRARRPPWIDALLVGWLAWGFDTINNLAPVRQGLAERHAGRVLDLERAHELDVELALNRWLRHRHALSEIVVLWYENVHAIVTFAVVGALWWRRSDPGGRLRIALVVVNLVALAAFWGFPVAPPRMLVAHGYRDLVAAVHNAGIWPAGATALNSNQLTALPSLHIAWAVWSSIAVWRLTRRRWARAAAVAYPLVTSYAVMATANHWLADVVTGGLLTAALVAAVTVVAKRWEDRAALRA
jgi:hypothetical protein